MNRNLFTAAIFLLPFVASAQLGGALKRLKTTVSTTAETKVSDAASSAVGGSIDKIFGKKKEKSTEAASVEQTQGTAQTGEGQQPQAPANKLKAYSRFDFVQGEKVVYAEDFAQDAIGEFPLQWTTKTRGEVVTLEGQEGKWLKGFKGSQFTSVNKTELGDDYTIEFDMIYYFGAKQQDYVMPNLMVRVLNNFTVDYRNASGMVSEREGEKSFQFNIHPKHDIAEAWLETYGMQGNFKSDETEIQAFSSTFNKPVHYAIQVQKSRVRVWLNEKKIFDFPQVINSDKKMARVAFGFGSSSYEDDETGFFVSNIRIANGAADSRHKLLETGKFSTSGILFALNSDELKPESTGVIREIAKVLTENPAVRIKINGHTSSDGTAARNLELSGQRAAAVKNFLVNECKIEGSRIETAGLGDTQAVAPNSNQEGRAQNRRVEFVKL